MVYFKIDVTSKNNIEKLILNREQELTPFINEFTNNKRELILGLNNYFKEKYTDDIRFCCLEIDKNQAEFAMSVKYEELETGNIKISIYKMLREVLSEFPRISFSEISTYEVYRRTKIANWKEYMNRWDFLERGVGEYFENNFFDVKQSVIEKQGLRKKETLSKAQMLMADASLIEEIGRIYAKGNPQKFYGHPVHYKISSYNFDAGYDVAALLVGALRERGRLCSGKVSRVSRIAEECYDENDFENVIKDTKGGTVILEMSGVGDEETNFAKDYQRVAEFILRCIKKYSREVLFIFLENSNKPGFSKNLTNMALEEVNLIAIKEGKGDRKQAREYLNNLIGSSSLSDYLEESKDDIILDQDRYTASELHDKYNRWNKDCIRNKVYRSYKTCNVEVSNVEKHEKSYDDLHKLVGLDAVKNIVDDIIAESVVSKQRRKTLNHEFTSSKHMIFTGNPGSCKTTVARILTKVLKEEGVLDTGAFVECGSADLTGKYVGWTDKIVRSKFREAQGGILFIDEAYSLAGREGDYGEEAINTIVQEMENHREDVTVIFAGYPDKMKVFLDKNEGLRSRIPFHVEFPDYNAEELLKIFEKMLKDKDYSATKEAMDKALAVFSKASQIPEYGNGRYARNVLEQSLMKQARRLYNKYKGKDIPREELAVLEAEDIAEVKVDNEANRTKSIGFLG